MKLLTGKVAIVTGAGRGIGRATALLFAEHGAHVIVNDLGVDARGKPAPEQVAASVVAEIKERGGSAVASTHDVSKASGATELAALALSHNGAIDVLINNAGIHRDASLLKVALEDWQAVIDVQLQAALLCTQAVVPHMKENGGGSIVNTTSNAGLYGNYGQASTATALAGIYGLTRTCAIELQRHQVRVNAVAPLAKTRLTEQLPIFHQVDSMSAEHVAPVHLFLASALSADLTGAVVSVAGGRISSYKMVESRGQFKEGEGGIWTAEEIAEHWPAISKA